MKICVLTTSFPRNQNDSAGIFIARTVAALSEIKVEGIVISPFEKGCLSEEKLFGFDIKRIKYGFFCAGQLAYGLGILPNLKSKPLLILQIPGLLLSFFVNALKNAKNCDLIHAHWIFCAIPAFFVGKICRKPVIASVRGEDLKLLKIPILGYTLKKILNSNLKITTISEEFKENLQKLFPSKEIYLVPNGVNAATRDIDELKNIKQKMNISAENYAIFASRVIALKRIEILIDLLSGLKDSSLNLLICGDLSDKSYYLKLKEKVQALGLENRIHFLGLVGHQDYGVLLSGAKFYLTASSYEGRPNAVLEALASGVPVVASDIKAHSSLIQDGKNGLLFSDKNLSVCISQMDELSQNSSFYTQMSEMAKQSVSKLSWQSCAKQYLEIYKTIIADKIA